MRLRGIISCILSAAACLQACGGKVQPSPSPSPGLEPAYDILQPGKVDNPFVEIYGLEIEAGNENGGRQKRWIDFQSGTLFKQSDRSAIANCAVIDAGVFYDGSNFRLTSIKNTSVSLTVDNPAKWPTQLLTRFHTLTPSEMDAVKFAAISSRKNIGNLMLEDGLLSTVLSDSSLSPFQSDPISPAPMYIGFKTYTAEEGNNFGVIEIKGMSTESGKEKIVISYKMGTSAPVSELKGAVPVEVIGDRFFVGGKEFLAVGAAATQYPAMIAECGGTVARFYHKAMSYSTTKLLDDMYNAGLKVVYGMPTAQYRNHPEIYDDPEKFNEKVEEIAGIVEAYKDHPAILCWSVGNELENHATSRSEAVYSLVAAACARIKGIDSNHPVTFAVPGLPSKARIKLINDLCPDLDFLIVNQYYPQLENLDEKLKDYGWTKPFFLGEFGPLGTWSRDELLLQGRINIWGALIQYSSEEAASSYQTCLSLIDKFKNCLGYTVFQWGYQDHGEVLGWYPMFTKDGYKLAAVETMRDRWKGVKRPPDCPLIESWDKSIRLNGKTVMELKNPVLTPSTRCTASVEARTRNGNPLKYKWFLYSDNIYDYSFGLASASIVTECDSMADGSINEDAGKELFVDRTLHEVSFTAPSKAGNYRLFVIAYDEITKSAATACINFQVK